MDKELVDRSVSDMPDDVETLQHMVRWLAEQMQSAEESSATFVYTQKDVDESVEQWINDAREAVTDEQ